MIPCVSSSNGVCVTTNHGDAHADDTLSDVWLNAIPDDLFDLPDDDTQRREGWRIEVYSNARGKLYWRYRKGSGRYKPTIPGGPFDSLTDERKAAYHDNAERNRQAKERARARRTSDITT